MRHTTPRRACLAVSMEAESTRHDAPASLLHSCCAQVPFADRMPLQAAVAASVYGRRPNMPSGTPPLLAALVARCWHATPAERPPFESVQAALAELRGSCMRRSLSIGSLGELKGPTPAREVLGGGGDVGGGDGGGGGGGGGDGGGGFGAAGALTAEEAAWLDAPLGHPVYGPGAASNIGW